MSRDNSKLICDAVIHAQMLLHISLQQLHRARGIVSCAARLKSIKHQEVRVRTGVTILFVGQGESGHLFRVIGVSVIHTMSGRLCTTKSYFHPI